MKQIIIDEIKRKAVPVLKNAGVTRASIFGSFARGEERKDSDIDFLVEFPRDRNLLQFAHLKTVLEEVLNKPVDIVEYGAVREELKKYILAFQIQIL